MQTVNNGGARFLWAVVAATVAAAAFTAFLTVESGTPVAQTGSDFVLGGGIFLAAWACARAARRGGDESRGWRLLAVAAFVWFLANAIFTVYGLTRNHVYPFPSVAAMTVALVEAAGNGVSLWVLMVAGGAIAEHRWIITRAGIVINRSRQH